MRFLLFGLMLIASSAIYGQEDHWTDKVYVGGNLGLGFGDVTYVDVSPIIGYRITENFSSGIGFTYLYFRNRIFDYEASTIGGSVFSRYNLTDQVFLHMEFQQQTYTANSISLDVESQRVSVPYFLVGGGYIQPMGTNSSLFVSVLYDLIEDPFSLYQNPIEKADD